MQEWGGGRNPEYANDDHTSSQEIRRHFFSENAQNSPCKTMGTVCVAYRAKNFGHKSHKEQLKNSVLLGKSVAKLSIDFLQQVCLCLQE
jgi:hypothetical protein